MAAGIGDATTPTGLDITHAGYVVPIPRWTRKHSESPRSNKSGTPKHRVLFFRLQDDTFHYSGPSINTLVLPEVP